MKKTKRRLPSPAAVLTMALMMAAGFGMGWLVAAFGDRSGLSLPWIVVGMAVGMVQIVLHEGGHLAAGLATGYGFVSFRIGSVMLLKKEGRLRLCRYKLAGTGGQCLLAPPPWREEGFPAFLYNLGGPLANLLTAALCGLGVWQWRGAHPALASILLTVGLMGLYLGLVNGIPLKIQGMPNDGYNALCLRDTAGKRAVWAQLAIHAAQAEGARMKEMPADWFTLPGGAGPDDPLKGAVWVCRYSRLLDEGRYEEAAALRDELLDGKARLAAVHRWSLEADRGFFLLAEGRTEEGLALLRGGEIGAFLKQMRSNPGVALVRYAAARAAGKTEEAAKRRAELDKALDAWPYPGDSEANREMLAWYEAQCKPVTEEAGRL